MDQGHQEHGQGGRYVINERGERVLVERTKSLEEAAAEAQAPALQPPEATEDEQI